MLLAVDVGPGQSGPLGLLVVVLLCLAGVALFRSLRNQIAKVPPSFDQPPRRPKDDSVDAP